MSATPLPPAKPQRVMAEHRTILQLAWPIIVSRSTQVVVGLSDALMVAHLGDAALAATTTGALNSYAIFILPIGTVFIISSFSSQLFGKGDLAGARRYAYYGLIIAAATQLLCLFTLPSVSWAMGLFEFKPEVKGLLNDYLVIRLLSGGAVVGLEALSNYYGGLGNTRLPMRVNLAIMILNLVGNVLLIEGHLGFPALGVSGSAWASSIATCIGFLMLLTVFIRERRLVRSRPNKLRLRELAQTLRFGLPSGFNWFFEFFAFLFFLNVVVAGLGTTSLAAMTSVIQLNSVAFMPAFGIASAGAIVVGQAIGANAHNDVPKTVRITFLLAGAWQGFVGVVYLVLPQVIFAPFVKQGSSELLLVVGTRMLMISAAWQIFDAAVSTLAEALRAAGDTTFTLWARMIIAWGVFVPGSYITARVMGGSDVAAMFWLVAHLGILTIILYVRFRSGAWRRFDLTQTLPSRPSAPL